MSWEYSGFLAEKIEAGRQLLASDPAFEGSEELQEMVKDKDLTDALWRAFLRPNGRRRQGLSAHDKRQGLVLFLHCVKHKLRQRSLEVFNTKRLQELKACLTDAIQELTKPAAGQPIDPDFKYLGIVAWLALNMLMYEPDDPALHRHVTMLCSNEWSRGDAANAAAAEAALRAGGYDPLLTEADLEQLTHLLIPYARRSMAVVPQQAQMIAMLRQAAPRATRHLLQMEPGSASLKNLHAFMLSLDPTRPREAGAAFREVLQAAQETKSHLLVGHTAIHVALYAMRGGEGPTWSLAEVRGLLELAGRSFKLGRPYTWHEEPMLKDLKRMEAEVEAAAAARPGAERLPPTASLSTIGLQQSTRAESCDGCGTECLKLRRCAACKQRAYCCRECQVADWKRGHKAECGRLAAQRGGGAS